MIDIRSMTDDRIELQHVFKETKVAVVPRMQSGEEAMEDINSETGIKINSMR